MLKTAFKEVDFMEENKKKILLITILICCAAAIAGIIYSHDKSLKEKAKIVYPEDLKNAETIQKTLSIDKDNAEELKTRIPSVKPRVTYYIESPTVETAAEETVKRINEKDESLPRIATEKSDRTVVTPDKDKQKVDVYKVNLRKPHKVKAGVMTTGDKTYIGAGYQYGRWEGMLYTRTGRKVEAGSITYTIKEW